jgi:hypothetical protein
LKSCRVFPTSLSTHTRFYSLQKAQKKRLLNPTLWPSLLLVLGRGDITLSEMGHFCCVLRLNILAYRFVKSRQRSQCPDPRLLLRRDTIDDEEPRLQSQILFSIGMHIFSGASTDLFRIHHNEGTSIL